MGCADARRKSVSEPSPSVGELIRRSQERGVDGKPTPAARRAFETLYHAYKHRIFTFLAYALGNPDRAEELTQETFLNAWRGIGAFTSLPEADHPPSHAAFAAWLYTIARRELYQYARKHHKSFELASSLDEAEGSPQMDTQLLQSQGIEDQIILRDEVSVILHQLTPKRRLLLLLYHREGYSYAEIARMLDMSISAVSSGLCRANQQFQEFYRLRGTPAGEPARKVSDPDEGRKGTSL
jgi:RNA polymerase sigma-70 factor, ECF subfamily